MIKVGIFMADGCEEIEGLTVVDIVRRAKLEIETISITEKAEVTSSHQVTFKYYKKLRFVLEFLNTGHYNHI